MPNRFTPLEDNDNIVDATNLFQEQASAELDTIEADVAALGAPLTTAQVKDIIGVTILAGANVTLTYDNEAKTLTIDAAGEGEGGDSSNLTIIDLTTADANTVLSEAQYLREYIHIIGTPDEDKNIEFPNIARVWQVRDMGIVRDGFEVTTTIESGTPHVLVENAWLERIATGA